MTHLLWGLLFVLWAYIVFSLKRAKQTFGYFLVGGIGFFLLFGVLVYRPLEYIVTACIMLLCSLFGDVTGLFATDFTAQLIWMGYPDLFSIPYNQEHITVIYMMLVVSCLLFFPKYSAVLKILLGMGSVIVILVLACMYQMAMLTILSLYGSSAIQPFLVLILRTIYYLSLTGVVYLVFMKGRTLTATIREEKIA